MSEGIAAGRIAMFGTVVAAIIGGAVALYIHYDSNRETPPSDAEPIANNGGRESSSVLVSIEDTFVTPTALDANAYFFTEVKNQSVEPIIDATLLVDFGRASPTEACAVSQKLEVVSNGAQLEISKLSLAPEQSFYVSCELTIPDINKIVISGGNLTRPSELTRSQYLALKSSKATSGKSVLLGVLFVFVGVPFSVFLMVVAMRLISRALNLTW